MEEDEDWFPERPQFERLAELLGQEKLYCWLSTDDTEDGSPMWVYDINPPIGVRCVVVQRRRGSMCEAAE